MERDCCWIKVDETIVNRMKQNLDTGVEVYDNKVNLFKNIRGPINPMGKYVTGASGFLLLNIAKQATL